LQTISTFVGQYKGLFTKAGEGDEGDGGAGDGLMWFHILDQISNNDPTKWDEILEWKATKFFNVLQFYRIKEKQTREQWQRQQARIR
jgi:hypothetical protein